MRLEVKRVAVVVRENGWSEKSAAAKLQLPFGQAKTRSGTRHFLVETTPRMTRYSPSHLLLLKVTEQFLMQLTSRKYTNT
jgi:hypothetical protein